MLYRMHSSTVANRLLAKQAISRSNATCYTWKPSKSLLSDFKAGDPRRCYMHASSGKDNDDLDYDIF